MSQFKYKVVMWRKGTLSVEGDAFVEASSPASAKEIAQLEIENGDYENVEVQEAHQDDDIWPTVAEWSYENGWRYNPLWYVAVKGASA